MESKGGEWTTHLGTTVRRHRYMMHEVMEMSLNKALLGLNVRLGKRYHNSENRASVEKLLQGHNVASASHFVAIEGQHMLQIGYCTGLCSRSACNICIIWCTSFAQQHGHNKVWSSYSESRDWR